MPDPIVVPTAEAPGSVTEPTPNPAPEAVATPAEQPEVQAPAQPAEPIQQPITEVPAVAPKLYDLPDGRKVDGETLAREFKENFLPDYTRKSQALAEINRTQTQQAQQPAPQLSQNINTPQVQPNQQKPWQDPNWVPQTYAEIIEAAKREIRSDFEQEQQQAAQSKAMVNNFVDHQLSEIRKSDPNVNEDALFQHALKYNFNDLGLAYTNMKDMQAVSKNVEQRTVQNMKAREADPIAVRPGASEPSQGGISYQQLNSRSNMSAGEYLRQVTGK